MTLFNLISDFSVEGDLIFQFAGLDHCPQISELILDEFIKREPLSVVLGLCHDDLREVFIKIVEKSVNMDLCSIVVDLASGKIVAACLFQDFRFPFFSEELLETDPTAPIAALMAKIYEKVDICLESSIELHICAVAQNFASQGIITRLVLFSRYSFSKRGYQTVYSVLTNPASQRAFSKFCSPLYKINARDFRWKGKAVFSELRSPEHIVLIGRKIDDSISILGSTKIIRMNIGRWKRVSRRMAAVSRQLSRV